MKTPRYLTKSKIIGILTLIVFSALFALPQAQALPPSKQKLTKMLKSLAYEHLKEDKDPPENYIPISYLDSSSLIYHKKQTSIVPLKQFKKLKNKQFFKFLSNVSNKPTKEIKKDVANILNGQLNRGLPLKALPQCPGYRRGMIPAKRMADQTGYFDMMFYDPNIAEQVDYAAKVGAVMIPYVSGKEVKLSKSPNKKTSHPRAALAPLFGVSCLPARVRKIQVKTMNFILLEEGIGAKLSKEEDKKLDQIRKEYYLKRQKSPKTPSNKTSSGTNKN